MTNQSGGTITGAVGAYVSGKYGRIINAGTMRGTVGAGSAANVENHGVVVNQAGGLLDGGIGTGGYIYGSSTLTNQSGGTVTGRIGAALYLNSTLINSGVIVGSGASNYGVFALNGDYVTNMAGGTISGVHGVNAIAGDLTVVNAGTIAGTTDAVKFLAGQSDRLVIDPGAVFIGSVDGGNTIGSASATTLELASAASTGTLDSFGTQFVNFSQITVDADATWGLTGSDSFAAGTTLTNAGTLTVSDTTLTDAGELINNGVIVVDPSVVTVQDLIGTGSVTIEADSTLIVQGTVSSGETIDFITATGSAELEINSDGFAGTIEGYVTGETIDLLGVADATSIGVLTGNTVEITRASHSPIDLVIDPPHSLASAAFHLIHEISDTLVTVDNLACFAAGTRIDTPDGPVAVEALREGDMVLTASGDARPVRWIGWRSLDLTRYAEPRLAQPIRIMADAVADGVPRADLLVSPDHALFIDGMLIAARLLVNGATIRREEQCRAVTYYHVELDTHEVLFAEGLPAESYLDTGNRGMFENAAQPLLLYPDLSGENDQARRLAEFCAPFVDDAGRVEPIWRRLAQRADLLGVPLPAAPATTRDPDLCVALGDRRLQPVTKQDGRYVFVLPATDQPVRLVSRTMVPHEARPWVEDRRQLGVMIRRLTLRRDGEVEAIPMDHPALQRGWWAVESDAATHWRWTDGNACLPLASGGLALLEVEVASLVEYALGTDHAALAA